MSLSARNREGTTESRAETQVEKMALGDDSCHQDEEKTV
jgi:hypothetical protein